MLTNMSPFYLLMYMFMIMSSLMALSSNNWLMTWAALEINMLSFIPLLISSNKFQESEAMLKYFLAQALGSSILLITSSTMWMESNQMNQLMLIMLLTSLMLKLGMIPCHMWFPSVMSSISWMSCLILSTWQKLAPLGIMMFMTKMPMSMFIIIPSINAIAGAAMGMNQTKLKSIMAFSSITHMGWMSSLMLPNKPILTMVYLLLYSVIITPLFLFLYFNMTYSVNHKSKSNIITSSIFMSIILLSLSGLPPMLGFFPKWMTITYMINYPSTIITLLLGAMMNLFFYLNIMFSTMLNLNTNSKLNFNLNYSPMYMLATSMLPIMIMMSLYAMTMLN